MKHLKLEDMRETDKGLIMSLFETEELAIVKSKTLVEIKELLQRQAKLLESINKTRKDFVFSLVIKDKKLGIKVINDFLKP